MGQCLGAGGDDGRAVQGSDGDGGVVDDPVDDHLGDVRGDLDGVGGDLCDLVGQLVFTGEVLFALVDTDVVELNHGAPQ